MKATRLRHDQTPGLELEPVEPDARREAQRPDSRVWVLGSWVFVAVIAAAAAAWFVFGLIRTIFPTATDPYDIARSTAVALGLLVGAAGVVLALRRQIVLEHRLALDREDLRNRQSNEDARRWEATNVEAQRLRELKAKDGLDRVRDLRARFVTAAEQIGSPTATIRIAGMYAMAELASDWSDPRGRQSCVDALCAYLRMSSEVPVTDATGVGRESTVRETAQKLISSHLAAGRAEFWANVSIDLHGATLTDFDMTKVTIDSKADFSGATFDGRLLATQCQFSGAVSFAGAEFRGDADFGRSSFDGGLTFQASTFKGYAGFASVKFGALADFQDTQFASSSFSSAKFSGFANFENARFALAARFAAAAFRSDASFGATEFAAESTFQRARFRKGVGFVGAYFGGRAFFQEFRVDRTAGFASCVFDDGARFDNARFNGDAKFAGVDVAGDLIFDHTKFAGRADFDFLFSRSKFVIAGSQFALEPGLRGAAFGAHINWPASTVGGQPWHDAPETSVLLSE